MSPLGAASPVSSDELDAPRSMASARVLTQLGFDHGVTLNALLQHTRITPEALGQPHAHVNPEQEVQLIRNLMGALPQLPTLGLMAGTRYHVSTYGLWGYAVLSSATLGAAMQLASRMINRTFCLTRLHLENTGEELLGSYEAGHLPPDVRQFILDRDRASVVTLQREILGRPLPYRRVHMRRPEPPAEIVAAYTELFGVRPLFNQAHECGSVDASLLAQPMHVGNSHTVNVCEQMCRQLLDARQSRSGMAAMVRNRFLRTPGHIPDMESIAQELGVTSRTLRRHLAAEGVSFRALLEEVRSTLAEALIAQASLTHGEIAECLGYADVTTFIEAFRRWHGMPPSAFRRQKGFAHLAPSTRKRRLVR